MAEPYACAATRIIRSRKVSSVRKSRGYLDRVYHAERLKYPMMRVGPKGKGEFTRITWKKAIDADCPPFHRDSRPRPEGPQAICRTATLERWASCRAAAWIGDSSTALGASLLDRTICATAGAAGCDLTLGTRAALDPEAVIHSRYIINWGSNTSVTNMHLWAIMHHARKAGRRSSASIRIAAKRRHAATGGCPIRPGTDAALTLG